MGGWIMICEQYVSESLSFPTFVHDGTREGRCEAITAFIGKYEGPYEDILNWLLKKYLEGEGRIEDALCILCGEDVTLKGSWITM
jgi:hypothetical protein